jgi:hypothetical protein
MKFSGFGLPLDLAIGIVYNGMAMAQVKQHSRDVEAGRIRDTLDVIDISLYDLLVKRLELAAELESTRPASIGADFRELADSIRKITASRRYDPRVLDVVAGMVELVNWSARKVVVASIDNPEPSAMLRNFLPLLSHVGNRRFARLSDAALFAASRPDALALVPAKKTPPKDVWWLSLLSPEGIRGKVVGRAPVAGGPAALDSSDSYYIVAQAGEAWNFDRSIVALATSETVSGPWLKTAMHRLEVPLYRVIDSAAVFNGAVFHLVEISRPLSGPGDPLLKLEGNVGGVGVRCAGGIGGYFLPVLEQDKILKFDTPVSKG